MTTKEMKLSNEKQLELMFSEDAGAGLEEATQDSYALPIIAMLQTNSPVCEEPREPGCRPGLLYDTMTKQAHESLIVAPFYFQQRWNEWKPRSAGGGLVNVHMQKQQGEPGKSGKIILANGNEVSDTRIHFVLVITAASCYTAMISLTATGIKKSKMWMSQIRRQTKETLKPGGVVELTKLASFARLYKISSVSEKNNLGSWHNWHIELSDQQISPEQYKMARAANQLFKSDNAKYSAEESYNEAEGAL